MKKNIIPYQSCSKLVFLILGLILIFWSILFSIFLIAKGAWPVTIFLGLEYIVICYLIRFYFKEKNIKDQININEKEISIKKFKGNIFLKTVLFNSYWAKVFFNKCENKSKLIIKQSNKQVEIATFLHTDLKESLYYEIKKQINLYS